MPRPRDPAVDDAIETAAAALLAERGFAGMSVEAVAAAAGVGKPAVYRRYRDKVALATAVVSAQLAPLEVPDLGDTRAELWLAVERGFPADAEAYVGLIGGLIAEQERHPELIAAFREHVLLPRRAVVQGLIERGRARGDVRADVDAVAALDLLAGPLLARAFAGADTGPGWRRDAFATWWNLITERQGR
jgi:AcrR family transcriptional regulator